MRIGRLAERTKLSRDTIRFYERNGLIASAPSGDPSNTYRRYGEETVERLRMIVEAREAGLSVADLRALFHHLETGGDAPFDATAFFDGKIAEVTQTIERARGFLAVLERIRAALVLSAQDRPQPSEQGMAAKGPPTRRRVPPLQRGV